MSIDDEYILVGAYQYEKRAGAAYIYKLEDERYDRKITASDGDEFDYFGNSVSIKDNYMVIGAFRDDVKEEDSGSTYLYHTQKFTKSSVEDYNLSSTNVTKNGQPYNLLEDMCFSELGQYEIMAIDIAGNSIVHNFMIH
ncbi:FG-GAP repeat protein [Mycoplasmatota bacterium zrk1]